MQDIGDEESQIIICQPSKTISEVQQHGREVWTYISMQPYVPFADWRLDNPLVDPRVLVWQIAAFGFNGLLHCGFNQWGDSTLEPIATNTTDGFLPEADWHMC